jgi:hypothetical protein
VVGVAVVGKEVLGQRTVDYQACGWKPSQLPIEWPEKGVRKEDRVLPWQRRMARQGASGPWRLRGRRPALVLASSECPKKRQTGSLKNFSLTYVAD